MTDKLGLVLIIVGFLMVVIAILSVLFWLHWIVGIIGIGIALMIAGGWFMDK